MPNSRQNTSKVLSFIRSLLLCSALLLLTMPLYAAPSDLDPTWGNSGEAIIDFDGDGVRDGYAIYTGITQNGKHVSVGAYYDGTPGRFAVMRLLKNGQRDLQFGDNGGLVVPLPPGYEYAQVAYGAIQSDGKILVLGIVFPIADVERGELALVRVNTNGTIDLSFGEQGYKILRPGYLENDMDGGVYAIDVAVAPDDKILVASFDNSSDENQAVYITRLNPDGSLDSSFDDNGIALTGLGYTQDIILQPDAKLLIAGGYHMAASACSSITAAAALLRLNSDGSPDPSFGDNGLVTFFPRLIEYGIQEVDSWLNSIQILPDGRIFVYGYGNPDCDNTVNPSGYLVRFTDDGALDESFGENGIIFPSFPDNDVWDFWRSDLQPDGKSIVSYLSIGLETNGSDGIARFNADGSFDSSWNGSGYVDIGDSEWILFPHTTIDDKGRIIVTQSTTVVSSTLHRFEGDPAFGYTALSPLHRQKHIAPNANLNITFPQPVSINTGKIEIRRANDFSLFESIPVTDGTRVTGGGTNTITINPSVDFEQNTKYYVLVDPNTLTNASGHPFSGVRELTEWHFTTGDGTPVANNPPILAAIGSQSVTAEQPLSFTASASDIDDWQNLTFSLSGSVPAGASISDESGVFNWTPTEAQVGEHTFTVVVTDDGDPNLSDAETITIAVNEIPFVNTAPTLGAIGNKSIEAEQTLSFTATATDPDTALGQILTFSLAGNVPSGATINPITGGFLWSPTDMQTGDHTFNVVVTDNGNPNLSDEETITVNVNEIPFVNTAPTLGTIGNKSIEAEQTLSFTATATDPDTTIGQTLTFSLDGDVPSGAVINGSTGAFSWTPTEAQVGEHMFTVIVTDDGDPNLSDEETITVTVNEIPFVNTAPTLGAIGNKSIEAEQTLSFTATATDPDTAIGQILTFSLDGDVPSGAAINGSTGAFSWTPTEAQVGEHTFTVVVTDDGDPALSDSETITVTVTEPAVVPPTNLIKNAGFETKGGKATRPAKWTVNKLTSADRRICNVERDGKPDLIYAHSGQCAFRFQSGVVKARNIQQEIVLVDAFADQTLNLSAFVRTNNLTSGAKVQVMLTYADDSKQTVNLNVPRGTKPYRKIQKSFVLPKDATSARVRIITGTSKGTLLIDDLSLTISVATALPMTIPVPAVSDLRGN